MHGTEISVNAEISVYLIELTKYNLNTEISVPSVPFPSK